MHKQQKIKLFKIILWNCNCFPS